LNDIDIYVKLTINFENNESVYFSGASPIGLSKFRTHVNLMFLQRQKGAMREPLYGVLLFLLQIIG